MRTALLLICLVFGAAPAWAQTYVPTANAAGSQTTGSTTLNVATCEMTGIIAANSACTLPAGALLTGMTIRETAGNAMLGGAKFGTTSGGVDIAAAIAVGASSYVAVGQGSLLKISFSPTATQTIYIGAVTGFNSASLNIDIFYAQP